MVARCWFDTPQHLILPTLTLAIALAATSNRIVASSTRQVLRAPFYQFSMMKGLSPLRTFQRHGVRNILLPVVAFIGIQFITVIEGIVMIESLFSWPGLTRFSSCDFARDIPVIQGTALCLGVMFVMLNTVVDLLCYWIDPELGGAITCYQPSITKNSIATDRALSVCCCCVSTISMSMIGWVMNFDPAEQNLSAVLMPPGAEYWLGSDHYGRNMFAV